jgi:xylan 1,4-beta-xylosidase
MVTVELDARGMTTGDVAGLTLLNQPYAWIGLTKTGNGIDLQTFDQTSGKTASEPYVGFHVWL